MLDNIAKLTVHLLSLQTTPPYTLATQHPFLTQAGNGTLPSDRLALWLSQDRIYAAHAYPRFIGALISRIPFQEADSISGPREQRNQEVLGVLVGSLDNIVKEVSFFADTAKKWGLNMEGWIERKGTRDYTVEMVRITESLEEGLIFLWAMERVYYDAWGYVNQSLSARPPGPGGDDTSVQAVRSFATNWSSPEFAAFVQQLADLVDALDITPGSRAWTRAEDIWTRVIELEVGFWPEDGEELSSRKVLLTDG